jgi:Ni2+-binding GTPase involved in maturation of urease and hydrogenase
MMKKTRGDTGTGCHLEADMVVEGLRKLKPPPGAIVMVENVGNLVCPTLFDLGETAKVAILSVTEGMDDWYAWLERRSKRVGEQIFA